MTSKEAKDKIRVGYDVPKEAEVILLKDAIKDAEESKFGYKPLKDGDVYHHTWFRFDFFFLKPDGKWYQLEIYEPHVADFCEEKQIYIVSGHETVHIYDIDGREIFEVYTR